jgi:transposase InsO family protein
MKSSMSRKGNCWDNAPTESLWGRLTVGWLYGRRFATRREAMDEVIDWLNFYIHKRLRTTLDYVSPMTFEQRWTAVRQEVRTNGGLRSPENRGKIGPS